MRRGNLPLREEIASLSLAMTPSMSLRRSVATEAISLHILVIATRTSRMLSPTWQSPTYWDFLPLQEEIASRAALRNDTGYDEIASLSLAMTCFAMTQLLSKDHNAIPPALFGLIHGFIGALDDALDILVHGRVPHLGNANAQRDDERFFVGIHV